MNKEIEFKYNANNISIEQFISYFTGKTPHIVVSGTDHFYSNCKKKSTFFRIRDSHNTLELTFKRKLQKNNSDIRIEYNIVSSTDKATLEGFLSELGYIYEFNLYKISYIFEFPHHKAAYYICYDPNMKEIGRFIEIEMREDYRWKNEGEAWNYLTLLAKLVKPLGLDKSTKVNKSLYEMYRPKRSGSK
jgi:adenylate cyclase class IV